MCVCRVLKRENLADLGEVPLPLLSMVAMVAMSGFCFVAVKVAWAPFCLLFCLVAGLAAIARATGIVCCKGRVHRAHGDKPHPQEFQDASDETSDDHVPDGPDGSGLQAGEPIPGHGHWTAGPAEPPAGAVDRPPVLPGFPVWVTTAANRATSTSRRSFHTADCGATHAPCLSFGLI